MDPQACLNEMLQAIEDGDIGSAQEHLFDLADWIQKGGAYPALAPAILDIIDARKAKIKHDQRVADHIDGYDRDDLGESPDY